MTSSTVVRCPVLPNGVLERPVRFTLSVALLAFVLQLATILFAGGRVYGSVNARLKEVEKADPVHISERLARLEEARTHDHELLKDIHRLLLTQPRRTARE